MNIRQRTIKRFGWIKDLPDYRDYPFVSKTKSTKLPVNINLTPLCPPVYDQGNLGSCTSNGIAGAIQFDRLKQKLQDFIPSRLFIYYNERVIEGTINSDAGASIRDGIKSVAIQGDCPETEWIYDITKFAVQPTPQCYTDALKYKTVQYFSVKQTLNNLKQCLVDGYPIVFGFSVYSNFPMDTTTGTVPMPTRTSYLDGGHCAVITGYNDSKKQFIWRNSWGVSWGNKGYGTIPYNYILNAGLASDFWTIRIVQ